MYLNAGIQMNHVLQKGLKRIRKDTGVGMKHLKWSRADMLKYLLFHCKGKMTSGPKPLFTFCFQIKWVPDIISLHRSRLSCKIFLPLFRGLTDLAGEERDMNQDRHESIAGALSTLQQPWRLDGKIGQKIKRDFYFKYGRMKPYIK